MLLMVFGSYLAGHSLNFDATWLLFHDVCSISSCKHLNFTESANISACVETTGAMKCFRIPLRPICNRLFFISDGHLWPCATV